MLRFYHQSPDGTVTHFKTCLPERVVNQIRKEKVPRKEKVSRKEKVVADNKSVAAPLVRRHTRFGFRGAKVTTLENVERVEKPYK